MQYLFLLTILFPVFMMAAQNMNIRWLRRVTALIFTSNLLIFDLLTFSYLILHYFIQWAHIRFQKEIGILAIQNWINSQCAESACSSVVKIFHTYIIQKIFDLLTVSYWIITPLYYPNSYWIWERNWYNSSSQLN